MRPWRLSLLTALFVAAPLMAQASTGEAEARAAAADFIASQPLTLDPFPRVWQAKNGLSIGDQRNRGVGLLDVRDPSSGESVRYSISIDGKRAPFLKVPTASTDAAAERFVRSGIVALHQSAKDPITGYEVSWHILPTIEVSSRDGGRSHSFTLDPAGGLRVLSHSVRRKNGQWVTYRKDGSTRYVVRKGALIPELSTLEPGANGQARRLEFFVEQGRDQRGRFLPTKASFLNASWDHTRIRGSALFQSGAVNSTHAGVQGITIPDAPARIHKQYQAVRSSR
jgi:hypothetical protein